LSTISRVAQSSAVPFERSRVRAGKMRSTRYIVIPIFFLCTQTFRIIMSYCCTTRRTFL